MIPEVEFEKLIKVILNCFSDENKKWLEPKLKFLNEYNLRKRLKDLLDNRDRVTITEKKHTCTKISSPRKNNNNSRKREINQ